MAKKTVFGLTIGKIFGLLIFLLVLTAANYFNVDKMLNISVIEFLNSKLGLMIGFSVMLYLGELFFLFTFPGNLPAPIFNAIGGVLLTGFIFDILYAVAKPASFIFWILEPIALILVLVLTIIVGYVRVFGSIVPTKEKEDKPKKEQKPIKPKKKKSKKNDVDWKDIGGEFKMALYNLASTMKDALEPKKEKKRR